MYLLFSIYHFTSCFLYPCRPILLSLSSLLWTPGGRSLCCLALFLAGFLFGLVRGRKEPAGHGRAREGKDGEISSTLLFSFHLTSGSSCGLPWLQLLLGQPWLCSSYSLWVLVTRSSPCSLGWQWPPALAGPWVTHHPLFISVIMAPTSARSHFITYSSFNRSCVPTTDFPKTPSE